MVSLSAQEEAQNTGKIQTGPIYIRNRGILIDNQTVATPYKGGLKLQIHHRFSLLKIIHNLYGIYGSANTRIGLNYGITDRLMIGAGTTKDYKLQDIQWKYLILQQTEDNSMPVSLSYYGNIVIDARNEDAFGPDEVIRKFTGYHILHSLLLPVRFNEKILVQIAPSLAYFNSVPQIF